MCRQLRHRHHDVDYAGRDGATRHLCITSLPRGLSEDEATALFDRAHAHGAVASQTRKNNRCAVAVLLRQQAKKVVELHGAILPPGQLGQVQMGVREQQTAARESRINVVRLHRHPLGHLLYRHSRIGLEELRQ